MKKAKRRMIERQNFEIALQSRKMCEDFEEISSKEDSDCLSVNTTTFEGLESRDGCEDSLRNAVRVQ